MYVPQQRLSVPSPMVPCIQKIIANYPAYVQCNEEEMSFVGQLAEQQIMIVL